MITVPVVLAERSYDVVVGAGARQLLSEVLPSSVRRVAVVTQENVEIDVDAGVPSETFVIGDGEAAKSLASVEQLCRDFARFGLSRSDAVVVICVEESSSPTAASCFAFLRVSSAAASRKIVSSRDCAVAAAS